MKEMGIDADASSVNEFNGKPASKILQRHACVACQSKCHSHCHLIHIFSVSSPNPSHRDHFQRSFKIQIVVETEIKGLLACVRRHSLTQAAKCHGFFGRINRRRRKVLKF